jgi:methylenetetrahydrofolate--tRNA-(uracil-5-)-methyltransferase
MPPSTMIGALCNYITHAAPKDFQPMKANLGIMSKLEPEINGRRMRAAAYANRSTAEIQALLLKIQ